MYTPRIALTLVLLTGFFLAAAGAAEAVEFQSSQGWLVSVDQTAGLIRLAMNPSNPSRTVDLVVNQWVLGQCQRRLETRKGYDIWMDVIICPGSGRGCSYSYGLKTKG